MKRWSIAIAVLGALLLVAPAAHAQNTTYPSITTTTTYIDAGGVVKGKHAWKTNFYSHYTGSLGLQTSTTWTASQGSHVPPGLIGGWVYDEQHVSYESTDEPACEQSGGSVEPGFAVRGFARCQGTDSYYAWTTLSERTLPVGYRWGLPAGRHDAMVNGGNVYRWVSSDRRTLWITHINTVFPEPDQFPYQGSLWAEDLAGGGSGSVVEEGGFATFSQGGLCRWRTDSSTPRDPIDYYVNEVRTTCVDQEVEAIDARCVTWIFAPENDQDRKRDRDVDHGHQGCFAHAELRSACKITGPPDSPCGNFAMYRHWWWTLLNRRKKWTSGCFRDEGVERPLHYEIREDQAGRSVLHCWTHRFGSRYIIG